MKEILFVGEERSETAKKRGWTWETGHLAAKQLFDALKANGINPEEHKYTNIFEEELPEAEVIVGMGKKVQKELVKRGIVYIGIVHPAARGKIRKKENYINHIKETLGDI
jgi:protein-tyrosine-phosphatase